MAANLNCGVRNQAGGADDIEKEAVRYVREEIKTAINPRRFTHTKHQSTADSRLHVFVFRGLKSTEADSTPNC